MTFVESCIPKRPADKTPLLSNLMHPNSDARTGWFGPNFPARSRGYGFDAFGA